MTVPTSAKLAVLIIAASWLVVTAPCRVASADDSKDTPSEHDFLKASTEEVMDDAKVAARACDKGDQAQCYHLANLYEEGLGVPQAAERSKHLYTAACAAERIEACRALGWLEVREAGRGAWPKAAVQAFASACELGLLDTCVTLGEAQVRGEQLEKNLAGGAVRLAKACSSGYVEGCHALDFWRDPLAKDGANVDATLGTDVPQGTLSPRLVCPAVYYITTNQSGGPKLNRRLLAIKGADLLATVPEAIEGFEIASRYASDAGTAGMRASNASVTLRPPKGGEIAVFIADMAANCTLQPGTGHAMVVGEREGIDAEELSGQPFVVTEDDEISQLHLWVANRCAVVISSEKGRSKQLRAIASKLDVPALTKLCGDRDAGLPFF